MSASSLSRLLRSGLPVLIVGLLTASSPSLAADSADDAAEARAERIRASYSKFEVRIPMRDGVRLFTSIYVPNDPSGGPWPFLMTRTPYGVDPYGASRYKERLGPHEGFEESGFIFVFQDVRGKYLSEGDFVNMRPVLEGKTGTQTDETTDTWDTIEWLLKNVRGNNGKVGMWGNSYPGFYTAAGAIDSHPALAAVSPQAPIADWFWDDMHHHGAFTLGMAFNFFSSFGQPRPEPTTERAERLDLENADAYDFFLRLGPLKNANGEDYLNGEIPFWNDAAAHPNYDEFWQARNLLPHLENVGAAVMIVGGWYDMEDLYGPLRIYESIETKNPKTKSMLVMGPWRHGHWNSADTTVLGDAEFGFNHAAWFREHVDLPFFEHHLKGGEDPTLPEALVFETGANRWRELETWPPGKTVERRLYFGPGGRLDWQPSGETDGASEAAADEYVSDPAKPVPYTATINRGWFPEYMTEDQRIFARRPDVLVYETEVLEEDVTLAGPMVADLWVSTTGQDADWVVKVIDVHPPVHPDVDEDDRDDPLRSKGNLQQLVRGEIFRGRFRNSYETPEPFVPGEPTRVRVPLLDVFHTFQRGHRIMVQVQSSWFPLFDRNPQSWVENIFEAEASDFVKATHTVHRSSAHPTRLEVRVLPAVDAPGDVPTG